MITDNDNIKWRDIVNDPPQERAYYLVKLHNGEIHRWWACSPREYSTPYWEKEDGRREWGFYEVAGWAEIPEPSSVQSGAWYDASIALPASSGKYLAVHSGGTSILHFNADKSPSDYPWGYVVNDYYGESVESGATGNVTHWMVLPDSPEEASE